MERPMMTLTVEDVEIRATDDRRVFWMSDWTRCDELAERGYLNRKNYGPSTYGHVDFFIPRTITLTETLSGRVMWP